MIGLWLMFIAVIVVVSIILVGMRKALEWIDKEDDHESRS
jgi:hypothetical protein